jgi:hypothetical protein
MQMLMPNGLEREEKRPVTESKHKWNQKRRILKIYPTILKKALLCRMRKMKEN